MDNCRPVGSQSSCECIDTRCDFLDTPNCIDAVMRIPNVANNDRCFSGLPMGRFLNAMKLIWKTGYRSLASRMDFELGSQRWQNQRDQPNQGRQSEWTGKLEVTGCQDIFLFAGEMGQATDCHLVRPLIIGEKKSTVGYASARQLIVEIKILVSSQASFNRSDFAPSSSPECIPCGEVDIVRNKSDVPVAVCNLNTSGVQTTSTHHSRS